MKIDKPAVLGLDAPEVLRTIQLAYVTVWQVDVRLHLLVPLALIVLDFALAAERSAGCPCPMAISVPGTVRSIRTSNNFPCRWCW
jgi:hypothetical protein